MKLMSILPFLDSEDLTELIEKIKNKEVEGVKFSHLYPFLNKKEVDELVDILVADGKSRDIYSALPFMSRDRLNKLYTEVKDGKLEGFSEEALLPFLGKDKIKEMVQDIIKNNKEDLDDDIADHIEKAVKQAFGEDE